MKYQYLEKKLVLRLTKTLVAEFLVISYKQFNFCGVLSWVLKNELI